jgi:hypothetical protein
MFSISTPGPAWIQRIASFRGIASRLKRMNGTGVLKRMALEEIYEGEYKTKQKDDANDQCISSLSDVDPPEKVLDARKDLYKSIEFRWQEGTVALRVSLLDLPEEWNKEFL